LGGGRGNLALLIPKGDATVWMIKGLSFGLLTFLLFTVFYYGYSMRPLTSNKAIGVSAITSITLHRPLYWVAFGLTVLTVCVMSKLLHLGR
jgi:hypothetical protein